MSTSSAIGKSKDQLTFALSSLNIGLDQSPVDEWIINESLKNRHQ
jgi:hypothetical protein